MEEELASRSTSSTSHGATSMEASQQHDNSKWTDIAKSADDAVQYFSLAAIGKNYEEKLAFKKTGEALLQKVQKAVRDEEPFLKTAITRFFIYFELFS